MPVGPGVTPHTINLGVLADLTGPSAEIGTELTRGTQLFWRDQNDKGGVCGRSVVLIIKNHAGDVQSATALYASLEPHVLGFQQLLGEPVIGALLDSISRDRVLTQTVARSSRLLRNPYIVVSGTTYDVEMIDGVEWLMRNRGLRAGDIVGDIYLADEFGEDAFLGATAAVTAHGLRVVSGKVLPTDADMRAHVSAIRAAGARYILLSTTPAQAASALASAGTTGFDATFMASSPTFGPPIRVAPVSGPLWTRLFVSEPYSPFSGDSPGASAFRTEFTASYPHEAASTLAGFGYVQGEIMYRILKASCDGHSLERQSIARAVRNVHGFTSDGLLAPLDFSEPGQPPGRATYIVQPDRTIPGGLRVVEPLTAAPLALTYGCPC